MTKIESFIKYVSSNRRRTAIVFIEDEMKATIKEFEINHVQIIDASDWATDKIVYSDIELIDIILSNSLGQTTLIINIELFLAPRFEDKIFLQNFIQRLMATEPLQPIFILFYSKILYEKFKKFYKHNIPTENHFLESSDGEV